MDRNSRIWPNMAGCPWMMTFCDIRVQSARLRIISEFPDFGEFSFVFVSWQRMATYGKRAAAACHPPWAHRPVPSAWWIALSCTRHQTTVRLRFSIIGQSITVSAETSNVQEDLQWFHLKPIWFNDHPNKKATKVLQQQAVAGLGGPNHHLTVEHFELTRTWPSSSRVLDVGFWTFQTHEVMQSNVATSSRDVERVTISRSFKSRWNVKHVKRRPACPNPSDFNAHDRQLQLAKEGTAFKAWDSSIAHDNSKKWVKNSFESLARVFKSRSMVTIEYVWARKIWRGIELCQPLGHGQLCSPRYAKHCQRIWTPPHEARRA